MVDEKHLCLSHVIWWSDVVNLYSHRRTDLKKDFILVKILSGNTVQEVYGKNANGKRNEKKENGKNQRKKKIKCSQGIISIEDSVVSKDFWILNVYLLSYLFSDLLSVLFRFDEFNKWRKAFKDTKWEEILLMRLHRSCQCRINSICDEWTGR